MNQSYTTYLFALLFPLQIAHPATPSDQLIEASHQLYRTLRPADHQETAKAALTSFIDKLSLLPPTRQKTAIAHASRILASQHMQRALKEHEASTLQLKLEQLANLHFLRHLKERSTLPSIEPRVWYNTLAHPLAMPPTEVRFDVFKMLIPIALLCSFFLVRDLLNNYSAGDFGLRECATFERRQKCHQEMRKLINVLHQAFCIKKTITKEEWWNGKGNA